MSYLFERRYSDSIYRDLILLPKENYHHKKFLPLDWAKPDRFFSEINIYKYPRYREDIFSKFEEFPVHTKVIVHKKRGNKLCLAHW